MLRGEARKPRQSRKAELLFLNIALCWGCVAMTEQRGQPPLWAIVGGKIYGQTVAASAALGLPATHAVPVPLPFMPVGHIAVWLVKLYQI